MSVVKSVITSPVISDPKPLDPTIERSYVLYFLHRNRYTEPKFKMFKIKGLLRDAVARAHKHCEIMNYRFISVRPFMVNLDEQEERKLNNPDYDEFTTD